MRLVSQVGTRSGQLVGRLELIVGSQPGSVCSNSFDIMDANVACRQLGHQGAVAFGTAAQLGYENVQWTLSKAFVAHALAITIEMRQLLRDFDPSVRPNPTLFGNFTDP